jgi:DNA end-binding protein Ku
MVARAIWRATLRIDREALEVKLYSAVHERGIHFNLLDTNGHNRVQQRMAHAESGETVESDRVRRGVEVERGVFVVVDDDELARLDAPASRDISVERFVPAHSLDPSLYARPYWLGPDGARSDRYFALVEALEKTGREGIAHWAMRKREYVGSLRAEHGYLALVVLRHAGEVVATAELPAPAGRKIDERERKLGIQLLSALSGEFDPSAFHEEYRERVLELIAAKRKGKHLRLQRFHPRSVDDKSLADALRRSLRKAA